jgi:hypothetical protein
MHNPALCMNLLMCINQIKSTMRSERIQNGKQNERNKNNKIITVYEIYEAKSPKSLQKNESN